VVEPLRIWKYHGTGNDFVMLEDPGDDRPLSAELTRALCDRRFGAGGDGVIRVTRAEGADFYMDYRNRDGSLAEMCGNGIRCLGKLVYERGLTDRTELDVMTRGGPRHLSLEVADGLVERVTVDMGRPAFARVAIPMTGPEDETFLQEPIEAGGAILLGSAVSMGNPHLVLLLDQDPDTIDVAAIGPTLEHDPLFPEGTNVEFVHPEDAGLKVRVWERGVGETLACGTGACAAVVAAIQAERIDRRATVRFPGGPLELRWEDSGEVLLTGGAERVFEATIDGAWLAARGLG
jgi:diaminopimelate epimerase